MGTGSVDEELRAVAVDQRMRRRRRPLDGGNRRAARREGEQQYYGYLTRMSFLTDLTPSTFLAASAARVAWSCESTKPESCTVPL
jgi:hypothetical protein